MTLRCQCLFLIGLLGCDRPAPSPLGTFKSSDLPKWEADCKSAIVEENPNDIGSGYGPGVMVRRYGAPSLKRAVTQYRCRPAVHQSGWAVYTDDDHRVVGVCIDDEVRDRKHTAKEVADLMAGKLKLASIDRAFDVNRARNLLTAHWGYKLADEMLEGSSANGCSWDDERIAHGMIRWTAMQFIPLADDQTYWVTMCCWEAMR